MVNLQKYIENDFIPLDILGITSYGIVARAIWRNTWAKGNPLSIFYPYSKRLTLSTHTAVACIGSDGRKWLMEMDNSRCRLRYIARDGKNLLLPEEYDGVDPSQKKHFQKIRIFSGLKRTDPVEYVTDKSKSAHVCWIGRYSILDKESIRDGNEWLFDKYREGVPYDYYDLLALWKWTRKLRVFGNSSVYVCSELAQRCYEHINALEYSVTPMTPMDWQKSALMTSVVKR
jgi:hypothetical protein